MVTADRIRHGYLDLEPSESRYLRNVLRLGAGAPVEVRDGGGGRYPGVLVTAQRVELGPRELLPIPAGPLVHLAFAPPKGKRVDVLLEKATELGVAGLHPICTARSVRRAGLGTDRWSEKVRAAAQQCGLGRVPQVAEPMALTEFLAAMPPHELGLIAEPTAASGLGAQLSEPAPERVLVLTGPEGGFEPGEVELAETFGLVPVHLGELILRAETAPVVALTIVRHRFGGLG